MTENLRKLNHKLFYIPVQKAESYDPLETNEHSPIYKHNKSNVRFKKKVLYSRDH